MGVRGQFAAGGPVLPSSDKRWGSVRIRCVTTNSVSRRSKMKTGRIQQTTYHPQQAWVQQRKQQQQQRKQQHNVRKKRTLNGSLCPSTVRIVIVSKHAWMQRTRWQRRMRKNPMPFTPRGTPVENFTPRGTPVEVEGQALEALLKTLFSECNEVVDNDDTTLTDIEIAPLVELMFDRRPDIAKIYGYNIAKAAEDVMVNFDDDHSETIDFTEFVHLMACKPWISLIPNEMHSE